MKHDFFSSSQKYKFLCQNSNLFFRLQQQVKSLLSSFILLALAFLLAVLIPSSIYVIQGSVKDLGGVVCGFCSSPSLDPFSGFSNSLFSQDSGIQTLIPFSSNSGFVPKFQGQYGVQTGAFLQTKRGMNAKFTLLLRIDSVPVCLFFVIPQCFLLFFSYFVPCS